MSMFQVVEADNVTVLRSNGFDGFAGLAVCGSRSDLHHVLSWRYQGLQRL